MNPACGIVVLRSFGAGADGLPPPDQSPIMPRARSANQPHRRHLPGEPQLRTASMGVGRGNGLANAPSARRIQVARPAPVSCC